ncbi:MAG: dephospho-CoA kinase [Planctomycetota bacterium]
MTARPLIVGLAGGIASGKSAFARLLADNGGGEVIDADAIVKNLQNEPGVIAEMEQILGASLRTDGGGFDRAAAAKITFSDPQKRAALEQYLHPIVSKKIESTIHECKRRFAATGNPKLLILDVPLLFESGYTQICDKIIYIDADPAVRAERAVSIRGWNANEVELREKHQSNLDVKRSKANYVIKNTGSRDALASEAAGVRGRLLNDWKAAQE